MNRDQEQRLDEEIRRHLEAEVRDREAAGLTPFEARRAALRDFGNVGAIKEATREVWGWTWPNRLAQDVRYGLRMMRRSPGLSALAVASLAIGIGANTTVYTIVRAVLSPPVGVPDASRVMNVHGREPGGSKLLPVNHPDWLACREANVAFSIMCAWSEAPVVVNAGDGAEVAQSLLVTGEFFETLGLQPAAGRFFDAAEGALPVAVLSHRFWSRHPRSLDSVVRINGHAFAVIGVAPAGFTSPYAVFAPDVYVPLARRDLIRPGSRMDDPGSEYRKRPRITRRAMPQGR
jgi:hypothetical protein